MSRRHFLCLDCGVDTGRINEYYMLIDDTWRQVHNSRDGMLCIGCVESRLGRELTSDDFNGSYINQPHFGCMSNRLLSRLLNVKRM